MRVVQRLSGQAPEAVQRIVDHRHDSPGFDAIHRVKTKSTELEDAVAYSLSAWAM